MNRWWWICAASVWLAACAGGTGSGPTFSVGESQGAFGNPNDTPVADRVPVAQAGSTVPRQEGSTVPPQEGTAFVGRSPIPGESGVSNTSSVLSGSGGGSSQ